MDAKLIAILLALACHHVGFAQETPSLNATEAARLNKSINQYVQSIGDKSDAINKDIEKQTQKYLIALQKREIALQKKLGKVDSLAAHNIFAGSASKYQQIQDQIKRKSEKLRSNGIYRPFIDTGLNSLKFLANNPLTGKLPNPSMLKDAVGKLQGVEAQLNNAEAVKQFVRQRRDYLKLALAKYDVGSELKKYNQTAFTYTQRINDAKEMLNEPGKAEQRTLAILRKTNLFQRFMKEHGFLAGLFDVPADYGQNMGIGNLQSISQVQSLLQSRITHSGMSMQTVQASISAAQSELSKLRNKYPSLGDAQDLPEGFMPDPVKTQRFKKRLVFSIDMETKHGNALLPSSSTITLSAGYKLNSRFTVGTGLSYQTGYGKDIQHIHISGLGAGVRGYLEYRFKKTFFVSNSVEANYNSAIKNIEVLKDYAAWQPAALSGIGKSITLKTKFFKSTRVFAGYNWLHKMTPIPSPALVVRAGYSF